MSHVRLLLFLEMSRLARASRYWHHLVELCSLSGALLSYAAEFTIRIGITTVYY